MCSDLTHKTSISGSGYGGGEWIGLETAVVTYDHPLDAPLEHALCIDFRSGADPAARVAVELDAASARRLAESILTTLGSREARALR